MAFSNIQGTYDNNLNLVCTKLFSPEINRGCYSECLERLCHFWKFLERHVADSMTSHDVIGKMKNQVVQSWSYNILFERKFNADEYPHQKHGLKINRQGHIDLLMRSRDTEFYRVHLLGICHINAYNLKNRSGLQMIIQNWSRYRIKTFVVF